MHQLPKTTQIGVFTVFVLLLLAARALVIYYLNLHYIDGDQPLMWQGANDYSHGEFHEPRYYGQNYNTLLEGLFAVPLLWAGMKVYWAVPIVTHFFLLFPYLFSAFYLFANGKRQQAIFLLALAICLPVEFDMLTSIPRGFVTGLFFCSFFVISLLQPHKLLWIHVNASLAVIGFFVNQNSVIVSVPIALYLFLENYRTIKLYYVIITVLITYLVFYFLLDRYYVIHPSAAKVHMAMVFSPSNLLDSLQHLDDRFVHISFFAAGKSFTVLIFIALLLFFTWQQKRPLFYSVIVLLVLILLTFAFQKNIEGSTWPFYSFSRYYIGIPFILGLLSTQLRLPMGVPTILYAIPIVYSGHKILQIEPVVEKNKDKNYYITVFKLDFALEAIEVYKNRCLETKVTDFFVSKRFWLNSILVYGGPAVAPDFPSTLEVEDDRRQWLMESYSNKTIPRFMVLAGSGEFHQSVFNADSAFQIKAIDTYGLYLIEKNKLKTKEFLARFRDVEFPNHP
jgi:hypothetical protein